METPTVYEAPPLPSGVYEAYVSGYKLVDKQEIWLKGDESPEQKRQYAFSIRVAEGEFEGRFAPTVYTTGYFTTSDKAGIGKFLQIFIPNAIKKMAKYIELVKSPKPEAQAAAAAMVQGGELDFDKHIVNHRLLINVVENPNTGKPKIESKMPSSKKGVYVPKTVKEAAAELEGKGDKEF